jgi:hypothetical protein
LPTRDRVNQLLIDMVDAALDQRAPSPELKAAVNKYLNAIESDLRPVRQSFLGLKLDPWRTEFHATFEAESNA